MSVLIVLALLVAAYLALAVWLWRREGTGGARFDERQEQARGVAYKYGFFTLAVSIWLFSQIAEALPWIGAEAGEFLCLSFGGAAFSVAAIWKDAYVKLHERPEGTMAALALGGIGCLCLSAFYVRKESMLADGTLNLWVVVAVISAELLLILAVFLCRHLRARREEAA